MPTAIAGLCAPLSLQNILSLPNMSSSRSPTYLRAAAMLAACLSRVNMLAFISLQTLPMEHVCYARMCMRARACVGACVVVCMRMCVCACARKCETGAGCLRAAPGPTEICASIPRGWKSCSRGKRANKISSRAAHGGRSLRLRRLLRGGSALGTAGTIFPRRRDAILSNRTLSLSLPLSLSLSPSLSLSLSLLLSGGACGCARAR